MHRATGSPLIFLFPLLQEKPATSPLKPPFTGYTLPPSDLEQSSCIQMSSLTSRTQSPWRCQWETRKDCFLIAGKRERGGRFLKHLTAKRPWCNKVLFCFIFDAGKIQRYTGLPFKSHTCHSQWEFVVTQVHNFFKTATTRKSHGMFTWHLVMRERSNLCSKLHYVYTVSKRIQLLTLFKLVTNTSRLRIKSIVRFAMMWFNTCSAPSLYISQVVYSTCIDQWCGLVFFRLQVDTIMFTFISLSVVFYLNIQNLTIFQVKDSRQLLSK